jgi:hypothetical protein
MSLQRFASGLVVCSLLIGAAASPVQAQSWSDKLFDTLSVDFGYVARGAHPTKEFTITNKLDRRLHIASATPTCRICTVAKLEKEWLEPGESTTLVAGMKTLDFWGARSTGVIVTFDKPYYGQTRLTLRCWSRSDIVMTPGEFQLGTVRRGSAISKSMQIRYAGDPNWKIASATSTNPALDVDLEESHRGGGNVDYVLKVTLRDDAPPGVLRDRILLGINDAYNKSIDVAVQGNIQADVSISPSVLSFGAVAVSSGNNNTKQVLVRGVKPFKILAIDGPEDGPFQIEKPDETKPLHVLTVSLKPGQQPGDVSQEFHIRTDVDGEGPLKLSVSARLVN